MHVFFYRKDDFTQSLWENIESESMNGRFDSSLVNFPLVDAIRNRIFDGNCFSFSIVMRAIQVF